MRCVGRMKSRLMLSQVVNMIIDVLCRVEQEVFWPPSKEGFRRRMCLGKEPKIDLCQRY